MIFTEKPFNCLWHYSSFFFIIISWTIAHSRVRLLLRFADSFSISCLYEIAAIFWGITYWRVKNCFCFCFLYSSLRYSLLSVHVAVSFAKRTPFRLWQKPKMTKRLRTTPQVFFNNSICRAINVLCLYIKKSTAVFNLSCFCIACIFLSFQKDHRFIVDALSFSFFSSSWWTKTSILTESKCLLCCAI